MTHAVDLRSPARRSRFRLGGRQCTPAISLAILALFAQACAPAVTQPPPVTPTFPPPTATPTPEPPSVLLVQPDGTTPVDDGLAATIAQLAEESGLVLVTATEVAPGEVSAATLHVIVEGVDPGLSALAVARPDLEIFVIQSGQVDRLQPELPVPGREFELRRAFSAGYASSLLAPQWRIGGVLPADPTDAHSAFIQGGIFGCGLCNPPYPPYADYPLVEISQSEAETLSAIESLAQVGVSALYLGEGLATQAAVQAAAERGMLVLGADLPPQAPSGTWAASIRPDLGAALRTIWSADADTVASVVAPLRLESTDPDVFSPGRQDDVERLFAQLESGAVRILLDS